MTSAQTSPQIEDWNATVASNIRAELARMDLNQAQAATAMGVSEMWVSRRVKGGVKLDPNDIVLFARLLRLSPGELFIDRRPRNTPVNEERPQSGVWGRSLPGLDSNQEPAG